MLKMKTMKTKKNLVLNLSVSFIMVIFLSLTGCQDNSGIEDMDVQQLDENTAVEQTEIDDVSEGINGLIDDAYTFAETPEANKDTAGKDSEAYMPDCVTITKVITGNTKKVTLDFGEGCTTRNDNTVSGKIIMDYTFAFTGQSITINYSFEDFYFNGKKIEGTVNKIRVRVNDNGNPQATITKNIKIIWEDDSFVTVQGERIREWIKGFGNRIWSDNVFLITGNWTITNKAGVVRQATVTEPLRREMACRFLVSGVIEITKDGSKLTLDYGDGTCDDLATVNINGTVKEIHIRKRK
jgi:hypothetical protein